MSNLKPCPTIWCTREDKPVVWQDCTDEYLIICPSCGVQGLPAPTEEDACDLWNTRDSDRSGEADKTGTGLAVGESAGPTGIAQPLNPSSRKTNNDQ